jgi:hypothetical protein
MQAAAAQLNLRMQELCETATESEDRMIKEKIQLVLSSKDARALCALLQDDQARRFDVDIQAQDIIVRQALPAERPFLLRSVS